MARIAYILLCHKDVDAIIDQARSLSDAGDFVAIHFDARAGHVDFRRLEAAVVDLPGVRVVSKRVKGGWGEWSLVQGTLNALDVALEAFPKASHFYLVSGDCRPIKSAAYIRNYLDDHDVDFIESVDFFNSNWIKTGFREERLIYRHPFNERTQRKLFYAFFETQKRLGLKRSVPSDLEIMIGSQWWCLRRTTVEAVMAFTRRRKDVVRFFRTTWIPDEIFFQTLVRHLVADNEIRGQTPTFLMFTDYGLPVTFYNDHYDMLLSQDFLFARKVSAEAGALKARLDALYASGQTEFTISNEGARLFAFLTGRGRTGQRFAPRFWEKDATIGRDRELLIVTCKKWHVAKRLLDRASFATNLPMLEYLFDEEDTALPDLGGIQTSITKRTRHRRALMRMLFEYFETDRLLICLDPAQLELCRDFVADRCETRILDIDCTMSDAYLVGHAKRVGLAGDSTPAETLATLLPAIRNDVLAEGDALRDAQFPEFHRLREKATPEDNAAALASFLSISQDSAAGIMDGEKVFAE
ncbi:MAG: glycosyl transferase [Rhodobacteraceae bacterium]|nr:glycosyl transferase [Paracoccaceae bacterium]